MNKAVVILGLWAMFSLSLVWADGDDLAPSRVSMVEEITTLIHATGSDTGKAKFDDRVMAAMTKVPRHQFVPFNEISNAYKNRPLPIGYGQTISQPYIVALMTELMSPKPQDIVLEIGTGSGYQAAILAELVREVKTVEIIEPLGVQARERMRRLGYRNVETKVGDGYHGWEAHAPYDSIIVTAAASHVPPPLIRQLKIGGRMVIPIGPTFMTQHLMLIEKSHDGSIRTRQILPVKFVPLTGAH